MCEALEQVFSRYIISVV